jgi:hypothetical protein
MRPSLPLVAALLAAAAVPSSAVASGCVATAETPTAQHSFGADASGSFGCDTARPSLSVEVCLEVLEVLDGSGGWVAIACDTASASNATDVSATAYGCRYGVSVIRSTARGTASTGESAYAESVPTVYYCTPL